MDLQTSDSKLAFLERELQKYAKGRIARFVRKPLRTIVPHLMRRIGLARDTSLDLFWGARFYGVLPEAVTSMVWRFGYFDPGTSINILRELKEGGVFIDVGAHFGYFTMLASSIVGEHGKVVAIEAMPSTFERLQKNIAENGLEHNCTAINCAAFDKLTELEFSDYGLAFSSLNSAFGIRNRSVRSNEPVRRISIKTETIDSLVSRLELDTVDVVKIDAESSEYFVLNGMRKLLEEKHPTLIVELGDEGVVGAGKTTNDILRLLEGFGYSAYELRAGKLVPLEIRDNYPYCNLVFK